MAAAPIRVLVIEDNPEIREGLRQLFVREGYGVVVAETGTDAIDKARHTRMDVVVTEAASFALLLVACGTRPELTRDHGAVAVPPRPGPPAS